MSYGAYHLLEQVPVEKPGLPDTWEVGRLVPVERHRRSTCRANNGVTIDAAT